MDARRERALFREDPLLYTRRVYFETSNCCQYAHAHKACPLYQLAAEPQHLPLTIYERVLGALSSSHYTGELRFHIMSEPLCDPRLFWMLHRAQEALPQSPITIWTNGGFLSETLAAELQDVGVTRIISTAYSSAEHERLKRIRTGPPHRIIVRERLDEALCAQYEAPERHDPSPCYAPLRNLSIGCDGSVMLCCRDW